MHEHSHSEARQGTENKARGNVESVKSEKNEAGCRWQEQECQREFPSICFHAYFQFELSRKLKADAPIKIKRANWYLVNKSRHTCEACELGATMW